MRTFLLTILLCLSVVPALAEPYLQPITSGHPDGDRNQNDPGDVDQKAQKGEQSPLAPIDESSVQGNNQTGNSHSERYQYIKSTSDQESPKLTDIVQAVSAAISAFLAILIGFISYFQLKTYRGQQAVMDKQTTIMSKQVSISRGALEAAESAANSARRSVNTLPNIERAYLFVDPHIEYEEEYVRADPNSVPLGDPDDTISIRVTVKYRFFNHGRTPAIIREENTLLRYSNSYPSPIGERADVAPPGFVVGSGTSSKKGETSRTFPPHRIDEVKNGRGHLFLYGYIAYDDIFGKSHTTCFCWEYNIAGDSGNRFILSSNTELNHHT